MDSSEQELTVIKRNGIHENVSFDKILKRVRKLGNETTPPLKINYGQLVMKVILLLGLVLMDLGPQQAL